MSLPASAFLIQKERRFPIRKASGAFDELGVRAAKACLASAARLDDTQKARLGAFASRLAKALWDFDGLEQAGRLRTDWGFPIIIDRPKGFIQTGVGPDGTPWEREFKVDYGFLPDTIGLDGDEIDVYCGPDPKASMVHVVNQVKADGATLDEYKLMIGFDQTEDAIACLFEHLPERYFGSMHTMPLDLLRGLLNFEEPGAVQKALAFQAMRDSLVALSSGAALFGSVQLVKSRRQVRLEKALVTAKAFVGEPIPIESHPAMYDHPGTTGWFTGMYDDPDRVGGWLGWIEPPDDEWIVFVDVDGKALLWTEREPDGGVIGAPYLFRRDDLAYIARPTDTERRRIVQMASTWFDAAAPVDKSREARVAYWVTCPENDVQVEKGGMQPGERRLVYGIVLEPEPNGGAGDAHDETYSAEVIERACHDFMAFGQNLTSPHKVFVNDQAQIVECFIVPEDYTRNGTVVRKGAWVMVLRVVGDTLWQEILSGAKTAFSIEGLAKRILNAVLPQRAAA